MSEQKSHVTIGTNTVNDYVKRLTVVPRATISPEGTGFR